MTSQPDPAGVIRHHPLSHNHHPSLARRTSPISIPSPAGPSHTQPGYFDLSKVDHRTHHRHHANTISATTGHIRKGTGNSEADLLGVGPSQRMRRSGQTSSKASPAFSQTSVVEDDQEVDLNMTLRPDGFRSDSNGSKPWAVYVDSLSREEMAIVETRFDLMTDEELEEHLGRSDRPSAATSPAMELLTPQEPPDKGPSTSPTTPKATRDNLSLWLTSTGVEDDQSPLFPPSPPSHPAKLVTRDHPLRILSRAIKELKESVQRLEEENERLRAHRTPENGRKATDQVGSPMHVALISDFHTR